MLTTTAGCINSIPNPLGGSGSSGENTPARDPDPFAGISSQGYDLLVRFETHPEATSGNSTARATKDNTRTSPGTIRSTTPSERGSAVDHGPGATDIAQVALVNSAGKLIGSASVGENTTARLDLLTLADGGRRIARAYDFGRHRVVAITHGNQKFNRTIELAPKLRISRVAFPNQLSRADRRSDPLRYADPIIEFSNTGTAPAVIVGTSTSGSSVPSPRADREERREKRREDTESSDDAESTESTAPVPRGAASHRLANSSFGALPAVPLGVRDSVLMQTAFHPLAIRKEPYTTNGEIGGGVSALRREYVTTELDFDVNLQTREGLAFTVTLTVGLGGGVSEVSIGDLDYYVFRSPEVLSWEAQRDEN